MTLRPAAAAAAHKFHSLDILQLLNKERGIHLVCTEEDA